MIKSDKLILMCDKLQVVLSFTACMFLCGETDGTPNVLFFLDLLSAMGTSDADVVKRGIRYQVKAGQVDASFLSLSERWKIGIKAVRRLMTDFENRGLLCMDRSNTTTIISMVCVKNWYAGGSFFANPVFHSSVGYQEGAFIYLMNGQQIVHIRANRKKTKRNGANGSDSSSGEGLSIDVREVSATEGCPPAPLLPMQPSSNENTFTSLTADLLPMTAQDPSSEAF